MLCEIEEREIGTEEIGKGDEVSRDTIIAITDEDLADLPLPTAKAIEIASFVTYRDIDPIRIGEGHHLEPDGQVAASRTRPFSGRSSETVGRPWPGSRGAGGSASACSASGDPRLCRIRCSGPHEVRSSETLASPTVDIPEERDQARSR